MGRASLCFGQSACRLPSLSQTGGCPSVHASPGRSPNQGRRAGFREHRPALGEISPFGCETLRVRAQRPCLGEIGRNKVLAWEGARNAQAVYLRLCRASKLSKRALFSQGGTMLKNRNVSPAERPPFSQARTMCRMVSTNVPAWESCGLLKGTYPAPARGVPAWERSWSKAPAWESCGRPSRVKRLAGRSLCPPVAPSEGQSVQKCK